MTTERQDAACTCVPEGGLPHGEVPYDYGYDDPADCPVHGKPRDAAQREPMDWFPRVWQSMTEEQQTRVRDKARWERMPLMAVLIDWPTLAPVGLRDLIPAPERDNG